MPLTNPVNAPRPQLKQSTILTQTNQSQLSTTTKPKKRTKTRITNQSERDSDSSGDDDGLDSTSTNAHTKSFSTVGFRVERKEITIDSSSESLGTKSKDDIPIAGNGRSAPREKGRGG